MFMDVGGRCRKDVQGHPDGVAMDTSFALQRVMNATCPHVFSGHPSSKFQWDAERRGSYELCSKDYIDMAFST